jgi:LPS export ABC transporter protein LptC
MRKRLLLVVVILLIIAGCERIEERSAPSGSHKDLPEQESWESEIILSQSGRTTAIVQAKHLTKSQQTVEIDEGLKVDFFNKDGSHSSVLTAAKGTIDQRTNNLKATGNVVLISDEGSQLRTEQLMWDNRRGKVLAEGEVTISTEQMSETGTGFEAYPDLKRWSMKQVTGRSKQRLETIKE